MGGAWLLLKISINIGAHRLHCITLKEDKTGKGVKYIGILLCIVFYYSDYSI